MALADIISRIAADAEAEADRIVADAEERAAAMRSRADDAAAEERERILAAAQHDATRESSRVVAAARLGARDEGVTQRRTLLDEALAATARRLAEMPDDRYAQFLAERIATAAFGGEVLSLGSADAERSDAIVTALEKIAPQLKLELSSAPAPFERGALVSGDRVRADLSLSAIVEERRDELELVVAGILFGQEA